MTSGQNKLKWKRILDNKCPKCSALLTQTKDSTAAGAPFDIVRCRKAQQKRNPCNFRISADRFSQLVREMAVDRGRFAPKLPDAETNFGALQKIDNPVHHDAWWNR